MAQRWPKGSLRQLGALVRSAVVDVAATRDHGELVEVRMGGEIVHLDVLHVDRLADLASKGAPGPTKTNESHPKLARFKDQALDAPSTCPGTDNSPYSTPTGWGSSSRWCPRWS